MTFHPKLLHRKTFRPRVYSETVGFGDYFIYTLCTGILWSSENQLRCPCLATINFRKSSQGRIQRQKSTEANIFLRISCFQRLNLFGACLYYPTSAKSEVYQKLHVVRECARKHNDLNVLLPWYVYTKF